MDAALLPSHIPCSGDHGPQSTPSAAVGSWALPWSSQACHHARAAVRGALHQWGLDDVADTAELLVSELVGNALRHARAPLALNCVLLGDTVCCVVIDGSPDLPQVMRAGSEDESGRGLALVEQLSARWGSDSTPVGKAVWFELHRRPDGSPAGTESHR
ncbi:ATP-binding protein [Streptomyces sp. MI02-7b]|uniref:ATP-binding protein n=1 Tax=Streptomyces sp. MI02-7b TaxID=462941 RepID=UPI0029B261DD|nr:ATP-binding protein [Streptomyces sp. MI02-7b]MDX3072376.1 ATP-binding protein [Streptomyces sp. MI02-7b]